MTRDNFDIDKFFREIEKHIESATSGYGGHKFDSYDQPTYYDDYFMEDKENIYMTLDLGIESDDLHAHIEKEDELVVEIDTGIDRIKLPTNAKKVKQITCVNGILDIVIEKCHDKKEEGRE